MATSRIRDRARAAGNPVGDGRIPRAAKKLIQTMRDSEKDVRRRDARTDIGEPENVDLLRLVQDAETISREFHARNLTRQLDRAYRAWSNQHAENSKYLDMSQFKGRSRLFVPKSRIGVRKAMAAAAAALFTSDDVANVSAVYEDDPVQMASAAVKKELLNHRLTGGFTPTSINWMEIATGGMQDSQLTGVTISKQYWEYQTVTVDHEEVEADVYDEETDEFVETTVIQRPIKKTIVDRPMIALTAIENCSLDPAAPWWDPVGMGAWFFARYPMYVREAKAMLRSGAKGGVSQGWLDPDTINWNAGKVIDEREVTRRSREGGHDRYREASVGEWDVVWIVERFVRVDGKDMHFWTLGDNEFISEIRETEESYPALKGERPYKMGVAGIETHKVVPMSPVEAWQPLQLELNDISNLKLDTLKRSIAPLAVVRRGKKVDLSVLQRRGQPEAFIQVDQPDDVTFQQTPGPSGAAYTETSVINNMFDELSGVYSSSSVASNRQLNETVGGMKLLSGAANSITEYDLRVWVETWAEPALRQISKLIDYYESDANALRIAGSKAKAWQRYGINPTFDDLMSTEVAVRINIGIGSADPMQRLAKLGQALEMLVPLLPTLEKQGKTLDGEALFEEIFGYAGFKDGARFITDAPQEEGPPPEFELKMKELEDKVAMNAEDNKTILQLQQMKGQLAMAEHVMDLRDRTMARQEDLQDRALARQEQGAQRTREAVIKGISGIGARKAQQPSQSPLPAIPGAPMGQMPAPPQPAPQPPQMPDPRMTAMAEQMNGNNRNQELLIEVLMKLAAAIETMNAPKGIIRDEAGRPIAVGPMPQGALPRPPMAAPGLPPPQGGLPALQ